MKKIGCREKDTHMALWLLLVKPCRPPVTVASLRETLGKEGSDRLMSSPPAGTVGTNASG